MVWCEAGLGFRKLDHTHPLGYFVTYTGDKLKREDDERSEIKGNNYFAHLPFFSP